jgi:hypothetical protein
MNSPGWRQEAGLNLLDLKNKKSTLEFDLDGESVKLEFYPHKLTPETRAQLAKLDDDTDDEQTRDTSAQLLADVIAHWDVTAGEDPYPPTYENLIVAPQTLVTRTVMEILAVVGKLGTPAKSRR